MIVGKQALLASAAGFMVLGAAGAQAQATSAQPAAETISPEGDIVVTAQRRSEHLRDVPIQVNAFSSQTLQDAGVRNVQDAISLVPNMTLDRANVYHSSYITLRGITQIENADPPVAVIVDGVPQTNQRQVNPSLYDVQQVEILKGPQGSLYGRNAEAGAINIVTKAPTNVLSGAWNVSYGNGKTVNAGATVSGALIKDVLLFRVGAEYTRSDGLLANTFTGGNADFIDHDDTFRGRLIFKPTDRFTLDARGEYSDFRAGSNYYSAVFSANANDYRLPQNNLTGVSFGNTSNYTLKADYDLDFSTVTGITGYSRVHEDNYSDLDFRNPVQSPGGFNNFGIQIGVGQQLVAKIFSQEIRLVSRSDSPFRYSIGAYYLNTRRDYRTRVFVDVNGSGDQQFNPTQVISDQFTHDDNNSYAGFGQVDYDIADNLTLTGGFRYDVDDRAQTNLLTGLVRRKSFKKPQPKATLGWKFAPGQLLYVTYGKGFRSGGFNTPNSAIPIFKDESLDNFEAGFKTSFAGGKIRLNGAVYRESVNNFQYFFVDASSGSQVIANIDRVDITGAELELEATPFRGLTANVGAGYTHTDIRRFGLFPAYVGNKTPRNIPFSSTGSIQYRGKVRNSLTFSARAEYQYNNKKYWTIDNGSVQNDWTIISGRLGIETGGFGIYVFGKNLTDARYYTEYQPQAYTGEDVDLGFRGQPRSYGVELRYKF